MHKTFVFPMECSGIAYRLKDVSIEEYDGELIQSYKGETVIFGHGHERYNPFDYDNLIPEFINVTEKIFNGEDLEKNIKKWHSEWGHLYRDIGNHNLRKFFEEAKRFYALWNFYKAIANKDLEGMKKNSTIEIDEHFTRNTGKFQYVITFFLDHPLFEREPNPTVEANKRFGKKIFPEIMDPEYSLSFYPTEDEENLIKQYQSAGMRFLFKQIAKYINRSEFAFDTIKQEDFEGISNFKIKPEIFFDNLIDVVYMQLYILFTENQKKICPICNKPFLPKRKDQKYCTNTIDESKPSPCYLTAKSRRYRKRKEEHTK